MSNTNITASPRTRVKLHPLSSAVGRLAYRDELRASSSGGRPYIHAARIWVRGYDGEGKKCYEELIAEDVDKRYQGPRSRCGKMLEVARQRAALLNSRAGY